MEAYIGKQGSDHRSAGLGNDNIRSPEWCVFDPRAQLKIIKAYKGRISSLGYIQLLKNKYPESVLAEEVEELKSFKKFLKEDVTENNMHTFVFCDGTVPYKDEPIEFFEFKLKDGMNLGYSQHGPEISMPTKNDETKVFIIPNTRDFIKDDPEGLYTLWKQFNK
jgi:hypothetical protein